MCQLETARKIAIIRYASAPDASLLEVGRARQGPEAKQNEKASYRGIVVSRIVGLRVLRVRASCERFY
jgi:hypothetical protein